MDPASPEAYTRITQYESAKTSREQRSTVTGKESTNAQGSADSDSLTTQFPKQGTSFSKLSLPVPKKGTRVGWSFQVRMVISRHRNADSSVSFFLLPLLRNYL